MTAGNQPSANSINTTAGALTVQLRELMIGIANFNQELGILGADGIEALGISAADANTLISTFGNLAQLNAIYVGGSGFAALDYRDNSAALWGIS